MPKSMLWKIMVSVICGVVMSPFVGTMISNFYIPYAKSDGGISSVFEVSTIAAFPIMGAIVFILLQRIFPAN